MSGVVDRIVGLPPGLVLALVFALPALEASLFLGFIFPGEIAVLLGGVLANEGKLPLWAVIVVGAAGAIVGDSVGYEVGRHYGERLLSRLPSRLVKPAHVERAKALIHRRRGQAIFLGRFTAALRVLVPGLAGVARLPYRSFLGWNVAGGAAWAAETAVVGFVAGRSYKAAAHRLSLIGLGLLVLIVAGYTFAHFRDHPAVRRWVAARLDATRWTGRPLTLLGVSAAVSGWLFGALLQDVLGNDGIATADPRLRTDVLSWRQPVLTTAAKIVTQLGAEPVVWLVIAAAALIAGRRRRPLEAVLVVTASVSGVASRRLISDLVGRARPPRQTWLVTAHSHAWPSGHSATAVIVYGLLAALAWPALTTGRIRIGLVIAAVLLVACVGVSRVYLGVHWVSDVLGGWAFGALWLTAALTVLALLRRSGASTERRPPASTPRTG